MSRESQSLEYLLDLHGYDANDAGRPYHYVDAGQLVKDFWEAVDKRVILMKEQCYE